MKKYYRVEIAFIDEQGAVVPPGVYSETDVDVSYARNRTVLLLQGAASATTTEIVPEAKSFVTNVKNEFVINQPTTQTVVHKIKINSDSLEKLIALKWVGKVIANKVVSERNIARFTSAEDLDKRVPLPGSKKWELIAPIDFEIIENNNQELFFF